MNEHFQLAGLEFEIRRSERRKTLGLAIDRGGELVVYAPVKTEQEELVHWAQKKLIWVHRKLALKETMWPKINKPEYVSGEMFFYLGHSYKLTLVEHQKSPLVFDGNRFTLLRSAREEAEGEFRKWYASKGASWIASRVKLLARKTTVGPSRIALRNLGFRWGSCGKNDVLFFDWRLLQLPVRLADYVLCHELLHLRIPNHSHAFWSLFDGVQPDWEERKSALAAQAQIIHWFADTQSCSRDRFMPRNQDR